jgi:hypothetical protein
MELQKSWNGSWYLCSIAGLFCSWQYLMTRPEFSLKDSELQQLQQKKDIKSRFTYLLRKYKPRNKKDVLWLAGICVALGAMQYNRNRSFTY